MWDVIVNAPRLPWASPTPPQRLPNASLTPFQRRLNATPTPPQDLPNAYPSQVRTTTFPEAPGTLDGVAPKDTWQASLARCLVKQTWVIPESVRTIDAAMVPIVSFSTKLVVSGGQPLRLDVSFEGESHSGLTMAQPTPHHGTTHHGTTHYGATHHGTTHHGTTHHGTTHCGTTHCGTTHCGTTHYGATHYGTTHYGIYSLRQC